MNVFFLRMFILFCWRLRFLRKGKELNILLEIFLSLLWFSWRNCKVFSFWKLFVLRFISLFFERFSKWRKCCWWNDLFLILFRVFLFKYRWYKYWYFFKEVVFNLWMLWELIYRVLSFNGSDWGMFVNLILFWKL